ncbi:MAG: AHH domain-containing protein, partial [Tannerellaceae bacterium]|nr:AHH domain-containing protein [Tannerellaceae bacterium]
VTQVSGAGTFSGAGYVGIPYLNNAQVAVSFSNITVNTDHQLLTGYIETQFDPITSHLLLDVEAGGVTPISSAGSDVRLDQATREAPHTDLAVLQFEETPNTKYALDPYRDIYAKVTEYYLSYKPTSKDLIASAKFMLPGVSDEVFVRITESHEGFDASKVRFVTDKGREYKGTYNGKDGWTLPLAGSAPNDGQQLYAVQETSPGQYATLARLNLYTYEPKSIKVKLVPINGFTANTVSKELNAIYNKVGINCEVEISGSFEYAPLQSGTFNVTGSGLFSTLTDDMKALNQAYLQAHPDETALCLFLIENASGTEVLTGDMPRGQQFGYLFKGSTAQTIAHEIGHGLFHLDHPFDRANAAKSFDRGDLSDNLMEYSGGTNLVKLQWDAIHAPGLVIGLFERDDSGMAKEESTDILFQIIEKILLQGENGCGFIRKLISSTPNIELNTSFETTAIDYLIGKAENGNISFHIETGSTQRIEISPQIIKFIKESEKKELVLWVSNGNIQICEASEDYTSFTSLSKAKDDPTFLAKYKTDLLSCKGKTLLEILRQLKSHTRNNQGIELSFADYVYTIKNDRLQLVDLQDEAINAGEWTETDKDTRIRYYINEAGIIQVKAFGFRKDLSTIKNVDLPGLANHIKEQSNRFLRENQVKDFSALAPVFTNTAEIFADGKKIEIGSNESTFIKIISEGIGLTTTLLKTGEIEEQVYLASTEGATTIHAPGLVTGGVEVIAQKVTDITALATTVYDLAVDKEARSWLYHQFVAIKNEIGEDPQNLIILLRDVILTVATGNSADEWKATVDGTTDTGKRSHLATRGTGNAIITVIAGTAIVNNLPDIAEQLTENIRKVRNIRTVFSSVEEMLSDIVRNRDVIRRVLDMEAGKEYARKYFNNVVKEGIFEDWWNTAKRYDLNDELNFEVHHVIPISVLENNKELQDLLFKFQDRFDFNGIDNAIPLQKKSIRFDVSGHANHPKYDAVIREQIEDIFEDTTLDDSGRFEEIREFINATKSRLENEVLLGNRNVNDIIIF